jgi:hypothetical protein
MDETSLRRKPSSERASEVDSLPGELDDADKAAIGSSNEFNTG